MAKLAGVDGCKAGWFALLEDTGARQIVGHVAPSFHRLMRELGECDVVAVDIPIGLHDRGARACDKAARQLLRPKRGSSVFPAPIRSALTTRTHAEASKIRGAMEGKGMSIQAFAIMAKIAEVDDYVRSRGQQQSRVFEVHPEVCFTALAGGRPMQHNKLRAAGRDERWELLSKEFTWEQIEPIRAAFPVGMVRHDDLHDALVCLWSARRISRGAAQRVPPQREFDPAGIDTAIWY